jgi:hypothetical protein
MDITEKKTILYTSVNVTDWTYLQIQRQNFWHEHPYTTTTNHHIVNKIKYSV